MQPDRNLSYNPLFQVWFVLQNTPQASLEFPRIVWKNIEIDSGIVRHDLMLSLSELDSELNGKFEYKTDLFQKDTIIQMVEHFKTILVQMTTHPDMTLSQIKESIDAAKQQYRLQQEQELFGKLGQKLKGIKRKKANNR